MLDVNFKNPFHKKVFNSDNDKTEFKVFQELQ